MSRIERQNPLAPFVAAVLGAILGVGVQFTLSNNGRPPFVPPASIAITLLSIALVLLAFAIRLRRTVTSKKKRLIDPFHAVRLLIASRAGQLVGGVFGGFAGGLLLPLSLRSVPAPSATWVPMVVLLIAAAVLVICAMIAEYLCRIPPSDDENAEAESTEHEPGPNDQTAYRNDL